MAFLIRNKLSVRASYYGDVPGKVQRTPEFVAIKKELKKADDVLVIANTRAKQLAIYALRVYENYTTHFAYCQRILRIL